MNRRKGPCATKRALWPTTAHLRSRAAEVAAQHGVDEAALFTRSMRSNLIAARWETWRRLHIEDGFRIGSIARIWGCDHTSIINAMKRMAMP